MRGCTGFKGRTGLEIENLILVLCVSVSQAWMPVTTVESSVTVPSPGCFSWLEVLRLVNRAESLPFQDATSGTNCVDRAVHIVCPQTM